MDGIFAINKQSGSTSTQVVSKLKWLLKQKRVGHMGTLDPMASGVLLVGVGKATRLFNYFLKKTKEYIAEFEFGQSTDTLDSLGQVVATTANIPDCHQIQQCLGGFLGAISQLPPAYSAKHINGIRAYELARKGIVPDLKPSQVEIYEFELLKQLSQNKFEFKIVCSGGTYIRSLARDLGEQCCSLAIMTALKRTRCGDFCLQDCADVQQIALEPQKYITSISRSLHSLARYDLNASFYKQLCDGAQILVDDAPQNDFLLFCNNELFGIASLVNNAIKINTYLKTTGQ